MVGGHELGHGLFRINSADLMYMVFFCLFIYHIKLTSFLIQM